MGFIGNLDVLGKFDVIIEYFLSWPVCNNIHWSHTMCQILPMGFTFSSHNAIPIFTHKGGALNCNTPMRIKSHLMYCFPKRIWAKLEEYFDLQEVQTRRSLGKDIGHDEEEENSIPELNETFRHWVWALVSQKQSFHGSEILQSDLFSCYLKWKRPWFIVFAWTAHLCPDSCLLMCLLCLYKHVISRAVRGAMW